jgi:hypothetical protein
MNVIWHDDPGMQCKSFAGMMPDRGRDHFSARRLFQPALSASRIKIFVNSG